MILFKVKPISHFVVHIIATRSINMASYLHDFFVANCDLFRNEKVTFVKNNKQSNHVYVVRTSVCKNHFIAFHVHCLGTFSQSIYQGQTESCHP